MFSVLAQKGGEMQCRGDSPVCQQLVTSIKLDILPGMDHFSGSALTQGIPWAKGTAATDNLFHLPPSLGGVAMALG